MTIAQDPRWYYSLSREDQITVRALYAAEADATAPKPAPPANTARDFAAMMRGKR